MRVDRRRFTICVPRGSRLDLGAVAKGGIHWAAYAAWPLALAHGLGAGTDRGTGWMRAVDALCIGVVGGALAWRVSGLEKEMPRKPDRDRLAA